MPIKTFYRGRGKLGILLRQKIRQNVRQKYLGKVDNTVLGNIIRQTGICLKIRREMI